MHITSYIPKYGSVPDPEVNRNEQSRQHTTLHSWIPHSLADKNGEGYDIGDVAAVLL